MANKFWCGLCLVLSSLVGVQAFEVRVSSLCATNVSLGPIVVPPGATVFEWAAVRGDLSLTNGAEGFTISSNYTGRAEITLTASTLDLWERPSYVSTFSTGVVLSWTFGLGGWLLVSLARKIRLGGAGSSEL